MGINSDAEQENIFKSENLTDLLVAYRAMIDLGRSVNPDMTRFHRLESRVNCLWTKLSTPEQRVAVKDLVSSDHMTQVVADILVMSDGRIDMSEPAEPCWSV